ncbi:ATP-binding protein [Succinivibrio dextrinosolvens]|uniref:ATP-binding protein n=1 Tax=Succinivibrio dextrinosolvens TaxID=83771 RepID=UPI00241CF688|nr:ATP-binding protein [Succinivibrio dextrinosolvens]MBE6422071.1 ATP-binding protein [Succinivibrio dextrinosolvens]
MKFVARLDEMSTLENEYRRHSASFVVVYGRRRVGKTELIRHFIKEKPSLYFLASEESESLNRESFKRHAADYLNDDLLREAAIERWELIFERLVSSSDSKRLVIVIDEFQYIGKNNPAFLSVFQGIWDNLLSKNNVMIILCGSLVSMMISQTLNYDAPLYGRSTAQIHLRPIKFEYYNEFFDSQYSEEELVKRYSLTGGVPKYIEMFQNSSDLNRAIQESLLNVSSYLYDEPNFLLQKEVSEIGSYFSILRTIAEGNHKVSSIAALVQQKQTNLPRYLKVLVDLDLLEREVPVTENNPDKSKKGQYQIQDNFLRFWFKFIYPNRSYVEMSRSDVVMNRLSKNFIDGHVSYVFEQICQEKLWNLSANGKLPGILERIGSWWDNSHEIDVVGLSESDNLLVAGECKFWNGPVGANILSQLEHKTTFIDWHKDSRKNIYIIFSINGFTDELKAVAKDRDDVMLI